jgi:hypothetical protein
VAFGLLDPSIRLPLDDDSRDDMSTTRARSNWQNGDVTEQELIRTIQQLVAAGEYLDTIPGIPGAALTGGGMFQNGRRLYRRGSPEHLEARAAGLVDRLPPLEVAAPDAVEEAESLLGRRLPSALRRLYLEVGNGGFGPGYGLLGVRGGHRDEGDTAVDLYRRARSDAPCPWRSADLFPICHWGCAIYSFVDCSDDAGPMWGWDPNPVPHDDPGKALFRQDRNVTEWLARWVDGRLHQPWAVQDPSTGQWRGATDQEFEEGMPEE